MRGDDRSFFVCGKSYEINSIGKVGPWKPFSPNTRSTLRRQMLFTAKVDEVDVAC